MFNFCYFSFSLYPNYPKYISKDGDLYIKIRVYQTIYEYYGTKLNELDVEKQSKFFLDVPT